MVLCFIFKENVEELILQKSLYPAAMLYAMSLKKL